MKSEELNGRVEDADAASLVLEVGRLQGRITVLEERLAALDAAEEHHRVEMEAARAEAADAQAALRDAQARAEERRRQVDEMRHRLEAADERLRRAEDERAAVIAALGRRARRAFERPS